MKPPKKSRRPTRGEVARSLDALDEATKGKVERILTAYHRNMVQPLAERADTLLDHDETYARVARELEKRIEALERPWWQRLRDRIRRAA